MKTIPKYPPKEALSIMDFENVDDRSFLASFENTDAKSITPGQWKKLFAIFAEKRNSSTRNVCIYAGAKYAYDSTNRTFWPLGKGEPA